MKRSFDGTQLDSTMAAMQAYDEDSGDELFATNPLLASLAAMMQRQNKKSDQKLDLRMTLLCNKSEKRMDGRGAGSSMES